MFRKTIPQGTVIFEEGEPGSTAYIVERGLVAITSQRDGDRLVLAELGAGEIFGEMALIDDDVRSAGAETLEDTDVVVIDRDQIYNRLQATEPVVVLLIRILLARFRSTQRELLQKQGKLDRSGVKEAAAAALSQQYSDAFEGLKKEQDLKRAIQDNELQPYFMPIFRVAEGVRELAGFEALVRWIHPERGFVSPAEFVDMAETSGLIRKIDTAIMDRAWRSLTECHAAIPVDQAVAPPFLSVNLSGRHFSDGEIVESVAQFLDRTGCDPKRIDLEITESMLINDPEHALDILHRLKALGVVIALDDFGTGYSSLSYLHRFPIDILKVDQVFVRDMHQSENSRKIVRTVTQLAEAMELKVIAEGVETAEAEAMLRELGCELMQGYYYGKPLPATSLPDILRRSPAAA